MFPSFNTPIFCVKALKHNIFSLLHALAFHILLDHCQLILGMNKEVFSAHWIWMRPFCLIHTGKCCENTVQWFKHSSIAKKFNLINVFNSDLLLLEYNSNSTALTLLAFCCILQMPPQNRKSNFFSLSLQDFWILYSLNKWTSTLGLKGSHPVAITTL